MEREAAIDEYDYELPPELIASRGVEPRDSARLMTVDTEAGFIGFDIFRNFAEHVPPGALIVLNDTRVAPARLSLYKETGGRAEVLLLLNEQKAGEGVFRALANRKLEVGWRMSVIAPGLSGYEQAPIFRVASQEERFFLLEPEFPVDELRSVLDAHGETPVPHYLGDSGLSEAELRARYQSVFAKERKGASSVAAPTASLHFTERVFADLRARNVECASVTLHVGLGTFAPLTPEQLKEGKLHEEPYVIPGATIEKIVRAKKEGRMIIAVGTTAVRALESAAQVILSREKTDVFGTTNIFIRPGYEFKIVDGMVTNFHLPKTSLMMLVDALLKHKGSSVSIQSLYARAIAEKMRFYSFGDGMFIQ